MTVKEGLNEAYKIGCESGESLSETLFMLNVSIAFADLKDTNFYKSLSEQDKRIINECEAKIRNY